MAESHALNPLVEQFQRGGVPRPLRLMAAQGALPLKSEDLVDLLLLLTADTDEEIQKTASGTLVGLAVVEMLSIAKDRLSPPAVLAWALQNRREREIREGVLQNPSTEDAAIEKVVTTLPSDLAELVVINQVRLLRSLSLLQALEANPDLSNDQKRRLRELRESFHIGEEPAAPAPPPPPPPPPEAPAPEETAEGAFPVPIPADDLEAMEAEDAALSEGEAYMRYLTEDERGDALKVTVVQKIYRMNTAEKIIAALKGGREERAMLIRDRNRLVSTAVLGSPRLTEAEVESIAAMKNVSDEVLRRVGTNREWLKKYPIVYNLVKNPRTPLGIALGFITRLNPRDQKSLTTDRNVSEVLRKAAQRFVKNRMEKKS